MTRRLFNDAPAPLDGLPKPGDYFQVFDWTEWKIQDYVDFAEGLQVLAEDMTGESNLDINQVFVTKAPAQNLSLGSLLTSPESWETGSGFVVIVEQDGQLEVVVKGPDGAIGAYREVELEFSGMPQRIRRAFDLRKKGVNFQGSVQLPFEEIYARLLKEAALATDQTGQSAPFTNLTVVVYWNLKVAEGEPPLFPNYPFSIKDADAWQRIQQILHSEVSPRQVVYFYALNADRYYAPAWPQAQP